MIRPNPNPSDYLRRLAQQGLRGPQPPGPIIMTSENADQVIDDLNIDRPRANETGYEDYIADKLMTPAPTYQQAETHKRYNEGQRSTPTINIAGMNPIVKGEAIPRGSIDAAIRSGDAIGPLKPSVKSTRVDPIASTLRRLAGTRLNKGRMTAV